MAASDYETTINIAQFSGLAQDGDGRGTAMKYALDGENFDTTGGAFFSMHAGTALDGELPAPIGTLAALYRRYPPDTAGDPLVFVASSGGRLYARERGSADWTQIFGALLSDEFDFVTYEVNQDAEGVASDSPIDVLLLTNAKDGMLCVYGNDLSVKSVPILPGGSDWPTDLRFDVMARHAERIWVSGIPGDPDKLMYSAPYNPFDWDQNDEIPADGAGDILQPSWDGDSFVALKPFGAQLIAFKKTRVWRIIGTNPAEYVMKEQYGGGAILENTIAVHNDEIFMLGYDGIMRYDGVEVKNFYNERIKNILAEINHEAIARACACMRRDTYCLALPLGDSTVNNAVLEYNTRERMFMLRRGISVRAFLPVEDKVYYTSDQTPGKVYLFDGGEALPMRWESAWQDMGAKNVQKSGFSVYLQSDSDMTVLVGIETEKKLKQKTVALTAGKVKRVRLSGAGREWRLKLATSETGAWRLLGGILVNMEIDYD